MKDNGRLKGRYHCHISSTEYKAVAVYVGVHGVGIVHQYLYAYFKWISKHRYDRAAIKIYFISNKFVNYCNN